MKKVLFLMFLLFLGLGTANVKAQVRIGGNTAPNASAVLDLNANDTNNGTKGLALPRVGLTSNTMLLPDVTANLSGMMVYNTTTTGGAGVNTIGIYYWNGATWVRASLPSTSAADSGKLLMSNGNQIVLAPAVGYTPLGVLDTLWLRGTQSPVSWTLLLDTTWTTPILITGRVWSTLRIPGLRGTDICFSTTRAMEYKFQAFPDYVDVTSLGEGYAPPGSRSTLRCYRPSL